MKNTVMAARASQSRRSISERDSWGKIALRTAVGAVIGIAAAVVLMLPASLLISKEVFDISTLSAAVKIIMFISGAVCAAAACRKCSGWVLPRCIAAAILMYIIMLAAGLVFVKEPVESRTVLPGLLAVAGGAAAAILKSMPKKRRRS